MANAAAPRVTVSEQEARRFFLWGYRKEPGAEEPCSHPLRVAWARRWPNLWYTRKERCPHCHQFFTAGAGDPGEKLIDITGCSLCGVSIACEVKEFDTRKGHGRFEFEAVKDAQAGFLTRHPGWAYLWLGAVVPSRDRRRENRQMYLIPWPDWLHMREQHVRWFKSGNSTSWKSISLDWIQYWFGRYELVEHAYREGGKLQRGWFTQQEMDLKEWQADYPPAMPLTYLIPGGPKAVSTTDYFRIEGLS